MKILLTGGNGQLGLEISKQIKALDRSWQVCSTDYAVLDITNVVQVREVLTKEKPTVVINCAAHTAVDKCEEDMENAYRINSIGAKNLAIVCEEIGAKLVQVSTDYVFDGDFNTNAIKALSIHASKAEVIETREELFNLSRPWREDDKTNPLSIYGTSKLLGEEYVKTFCKKHFIIRTAWLYGEGNNFVRTMLKLAETNKELNVVADQFGSPTSTKDLATAILNLIATEYYGTYHGTCEGACSWYDFASKIFELKGIEIKVNKVTSEEFVRPAKRPYYSVLDNFMLKLYGLNTFRTWEEALEDYLNEMN